MRKFSIGLIILLAFFLNKAQAQIQLDSINSTIDSIIVHQDSSHFNPVNDTTHIHSDGDTSHVHTEHDTIVAFDRHGAHNHIESIRLLFPKDSVDVYRYSFYPDDSINYTNLQYIDTLNHTSSQYNPVKKFGVSYNDLGPISSAQQNQVFSPSSQLGFMVGIHSYDAFLFNRNNLSLYDIRSPYTRIFYLMGSKKENILKISHAQKFLEEQVSLEMDFQLYNHLGFYERQHADAKSFKGGLGYRTKDHRYKADFQYYHNKFLYEENGGIQDLLDFEEDRETNRQIIPINLENADNLIRISGVSLSQHFYLSKPEPDLSQIPDTNTIELDAYTITHYRKPYFDPVSHLGKITYNFNYHRENYLYTDEDQTSDLYANVPYMQADTFDYFTLPFYPTADSSIIKDSITLRRYTNELVYSNSDYLDDVLNPKFLNYYVGLRNEFTYWNQACYHEKEMQHNSLFGGVYIDLTSFLSITGDAAYYVGDYSNNDFTINGKAYLKYKDNILSGGINIVHRSPDYIYQEFSSSRLQWSNDFGKTDQQVLFVNFERKNLWAKARVMNIANHVYFDELYQARQIGENIQHIVIDIQKDFRIGHWGADLRLTYQTVSNPDVIRIPDFTGKAKLFYHNFFFNGVLDMELGIEANYFTEYYADRYLPLLRSWHIQNVQSIGNYPFLDVYFNAKIGKARLFVRYDNFNANFMDNTYYASPSYPGLDPMFRFGISWILFN